MLDNIRNAAGRALVVGALIVSVSTGLVFNTDGLSEGCLWAVALLFLVGLIAAIFVWWPRRPTARIGQFAPPQLASPGDVAHVAAAASRNEARSPH